jgi:Lipid A 3-O-deacylase (PagL)
MLPFFANAQAGAGFGIEVNEVAGKVFRHEAKFTLPIPALTTETDVNLMWHTYGRKPWQQRAHYPTFGIGLCYVDYGMNSVYGRCFGAYPNLTLPLVSGVRWEWTVRGGVGAGYVTKKFSRTEPIDTVNVAIGSNVNAFIMFMTDARYHINTHWDAQLGLGATHISDGSTGKPNLGINMVGAHLGVRYFPVTSSPRRIRDTLPQLSRRWLIQARLSMAMVARNTSGGPDYPVYIAAAYASRRWSNVCRYFAGMDYYYHDEIYQYLRFNGLEPGHEAQNSWQSALFAGNEFIFGRMSIIVQMGAYLHQTYVKQDPVYEKVGGQYYFVQREKGPVREVFMSVCLKTHETVAELVEAGFGIGF